jgi:hypothetical protein
MQKKYDKCKKKLDEANNKILSLLKSKIAMTSPPKTMHNAPYINSLAKTDP